MPKGIYYRDSFKWSQDRTKHGLSKTREYKSYKGMIARCYSELATGYKNYGQKGVVVCERWLDMENGLHNFIQDMGPRPENTTLDRINPYGNYEPANCRWADSITQSKNKRRNYTIQVRPKC